MKQFTQSFGFVIMFLVGTVFIQSFVGEKAAIAFLALVLLGMVLTNADKFANFLQSTVKGA